MISSFVLTTLFNRYISITTTTTILIIGCLPLIAVANPVTVDSCVNVDISAVLPIDQEKVFFTLFKYRRIARGSGKITYVPITNKAHTGETIRYIISARNAGDRSVENFTITQEIPKGSSYIKDSLQASYPFKPSFSIDGGETYSSNPKIDGIPVPTSAYTHIRLNSIELLPISARRNASYEMTVN